MKKLLTIALLIGLLYANAQKMSWTVAPNPVRDELRIETDEEINSVAIFDILGKKVMTREGNIQTLDLANLIPGIYIIQVNLGDKTDYRKFIKK